MMIRLKCSCGQEVKVKGWYDKNLRRVFSSRGTYLIATKVIIIYQY